MFALTEIKGVGRRYSNVVCKKADVDLNKRYVLRIIFCARAYSEVSGGSGYNVHGRESCCCSTSRERESEGNGNGMGETRQRWREGMNDGSTARSRRQLHIEL
jgi:hypothetical protein